ncbi:MAG: hypothetical protein NTX50_29560 [Candidatus Sumerlaeota bacterium]|nr:hypothetical protein [Candidatus Sumerlaeota bacterium]
MILKNGTILLDREMNARRYPDAEDRRWVKEYEKTLTPAQIKAAAAARAKNNNGKKSWLDLR